MPQSINEALVSQFDSMMQVEAAQRVSRLRSKVIVKSVTGKDFSHNLFNGGNDTEIVTRYAPRVPSNSEHSVRWGRTRKFEWMEMFADYDSLAALINPEAGYAKAAVEAMFRREDRLIIEALGATVTTGENKDGTVTFANDGGTTIAAGGTGYTFAKVKTVKKNFINNEVGNDNLTKFTTLVTGNQIDNFYDEDELVGRDFNSQLYIEAGEISKVMGMDVVKFGAPTSNPMLPVASNIRDCWAFAEGAIVLGITKDITLEIVQRTDLQASPWQVTARIYMGALRTEGKLVQKVQCTET